MSLNVLCHTTSCSLCLFFCHCFFVVSSFLFLLPAFYNFLFFSAPVSLCPVAIFHHFFCILYRLKLCLLLPVAGVCLGHICFSATLIEACSILSREYSRLLRRHSCQPLSLTYVYCILPSPNDLF